MNLKFGLIDLNGPELQKGWDRDIPFTNLAVQMIGLMQEELSFFEVEGFAESIFFKKNLKTNRIEGWFVLSKYKDFLQKIKDKIRKDSKYLDRLNDKIKCVFAEFESLIPETKNHEKRITESRQNLIESARYYYNLSYRSVAAAWSFDIIGWALAELIAEELGKLGILTPEKVVILSSYGLNSILIEEKIELLKLLKINATEPELRKHYEYWAYSSMDTPVGKPYSFEEFKKRIEHIKKENINSQIEKINNNKEKEIEEFNLTLEDIKDFNTQTLIFNMRKFMVMKNHERIKLHKYVLETLPIPIAVLKNLGFNYEDSLHISSHELMLHIDGEISKEELIKNARVRSNSFLLFKIENRKIIIDTAVIEKDNLFEVLTGMIASRGYIKGKVRLIKDFSSLKEDFKVGDILVTSMTTPDFVPLMEKAGGIITDEGGVTCHAAIVSREMGIPCIVGTEKATEILKDGMLVELDANGPEGKINILKDSE